MIQQHSKWYVELKVHAVGCIPYVENQFGERVNIVFCNFYDRTEADIST